MKNNKINYLMQLSDNMISIMDEIETNGISAKAWQESLGLQMTHKYQIKELYWDNNAITKTTICRKRIWNTLDHYGANCKYYSSRKRVAENKQRLIDKMKPLIKEEYWKEVMEILDDDVPDFYFEKCGNSIKLPHLMMLYRKEVRRGNRDPFMNASDKLKMIKLCKQNLNDKKRVENRLQKHWKEKVHKLEKIDWIMEDDLNDEQVERIENWSTEAKKSLRRSGIRNNKKQIVEIVRQRYSLHKENDVQGASKQMRKANTLFDLIPPESAKSFVEVTNGVEFVNKRITYDGSIRLIQRNIDIVMEIFMIMYGDKIAAAKRRTRILEPNVPAVKSIEIDGKPRHQSAALDFNDLDDVGPKLGKDTSLSDLFKFFLFIL
jgi:hypothetical protein